MKEISLSEIEDRLGDYLQMASEENIVITKHGKPAGVLVGFATQEEWLKYRLEHDANFRRRVTLAKQRWQKGQAIDLETLVIEK